jgi:hypothetical protein
MKKMGEVKVWQCKLYVHHHGGLVECMRLSQTRKSKFVEMPCFWGRASLWSFVFFEVGREET